MRIDVAVEGAVGVTHLELGAHILDEPVGVEHAGGADIVFDVCDRTLGLYFQNMVIII